MVICTMCALSGLSAKAAEAAECVFSADSLVPKTTSIKQDPVSSLEMTLSAKMAPDKPVKMANKYVSGLTGIRLR